MSAMIFKSFLGVGRRRFCRLAASVHVPTQAAPLYMWRNELSTLCSTQPWYGVLFTTMFCCMRYDIVFEQNSSFV